MRLAIVLGISEYNNGNNLNACKNDSDLVNEILDKLDSYDEILFINKNTSAHTIKSRITEFIEENKKNTIEELFFYYTGHGDRFDDDFFYLFSDFDEKRKETTGLRNSELDGLIRNLNPGLTIKIIDACYSGTTYIKSEDDINLVLEKSAKKNELKKIYFFYSSDGDKTSLASQYYSYFTLSFFKSITKNKGRIRFRDIMASIADDMDSNGYPKPQFIVQADNTEIFGNIEQSLIDHIISKIGSIIKVPKIKKDDNPSPNEENDLFKVIQEKSENDYCTKEEAFRNIEKIISLFHNENWPKDITRLFEIVIEKIDNEYNIPNTKEIGRWILNNSSLGLFGNTNYTAKQYKVDEYKKVPKPPKSNSWAKLISAASMFNLDDDEYEYRLETVEKERQVVDGFYYTAETPTKALKILFQPNFQALENYSLNIVLLFSRKLLIVFHSFEKLIYTSWDSIDKPKCANWENHELSLKNEEEISSYIASLIEEITNFIITDIKNTIEKRNITKP